MNNQIAQLINELNSAGFTAMSESLKLKAESIKDSEIKEVIEQYKMAMDCY